MGPQLGYDFALGRRSASLSARGYYELRRPEPAARLGRLADLRGLRWACPARRPTALNRSQGGLPSPNPQPLSSIRPRSLAEILFGLIAGADLHAGRQR